MLNKQNLILRFHKKGQDKNKNIENSDDSLPKMPSPYSPIHHSSTVENKQKEQQKEKPKSLLFNNLLISEQDLDPNGYQYDPEIINNIDRFGNSDSLYCEKKGL